MSNPSPATITSTKLTRNYSTDIENERDQCAIPGDMLNAQKLYDLRFSCSQFGPDCQRKREEASKQKMDYYSHAAEEEIKEHKYVNGSYVTYATGISAVDPRPNGAARYVDYMSGNTVSTPPAHGYFARLPVTEVRDPTCRELQNSVTKLCRNRRPDTFTNENDKYSMGLFCGLGTTWNPTFEKCVIVPDEYIVLDGTGRPFPEDVYPALREKGYQSAYDDPKGVYVYVSETKQNDAKGFRQGRIGCRMCTADRCRFPLTSAQGRNQARLYVTLFRQVYEYSGREETKLNLRYRIRELIDQHNLYYRTAVHDSGIFLPWHRWYILEMETILMQGQDEFGLGVDCENRFVGIPYFDWHNLKEGESPKEFINNANDGFGHHFHESLGQKSNRYQCGWCISEGALAGFRLTTGQCLYRCWTDGIVENDIHNELHRIWPNAFQYDQFRNRLEYGALLHGALHHIVGGVMFSTRASNDPIFFNHHGNIDKLWGDWQKQSNDHRNAFRSHGTFLDDRYARHFRMPGSLATPNDMLDLKNQRYTQPGTNIKISLSVEYVDIDTRSMWGNGNSLSIILSKY